MGHRLTRILRMAVSLLLLQLLWATDLYARGGGGGGGGGGAGGGGANGEFNPLGTAIGILVLVATFIFLYFAHQQQEQQRHRRRGTAEASLRSMSITDPTLSESLLMVNLGEIFIQAQVAWCEMDVPKLRKLLHPQLFAEWQGKLQAMASKGHRDVMTGTRVDAMEFIEVGSVAGALAITTRIAARANDRTINDAGVTVESRPPSFMEYWTFVREDGNWSAFSVCQYFRDIEAIQLSDRRPHCAATTKEGDLSSAYPILMESLCCVMASDGRVTRRERAAILQVLADVGVRVTPKEVEEHIANFVSRVKEQGFRRVLADVVKELAAPADEIENKRLFLRAISIVARADKQLDEAERQVVDQIWTAIESASGAEVH